MVDDLVRKGQDKWEPKEYKQLETSIEIMVSMYEYARRMKEKKGAIAIDDDFYKYLQVIVPKMQALLEKKSEEISDEDLTEIIDYFDKIISDEKNYISLQVSSSLDIADSQLNQIQAQLSQASENQHSTLQKMKENMQAIQMDRFDPKGLHGLMWALEAQANIHLDDPELEKSHKEMLQNIRSELTQVYESANKVTSDELIRITNKSSDALMNFFDDYMKKKGQLAKSDKKDVELFNSLAGVKNELEYISRQAPVLKTVEQIESLRRETKRPALKKLFTQTGRFFKQWHRSIKAKRELKKVESEFLKMGYRTKEHVDWDRKIEKMGGKVVHHFSQGNLATMGHSGGLCYGFSGEWALQFMNQDHETDLKAVNQELHANDDKITPNVARIYSKQYASKSVEIPQGKQARDVIEDWLMNPETMMQAQVIGINAPGGSGHALGIGKDNHGFWLHDSNHGTMFFPASMGCEGFMKVVDDYRQERYPEMQFKSVHDPQTFKETHNHSQFQKAQARDNTKFKEAMAPDEPSATPRISPDKPSR